MIHPPPPCPAEGPAAASPETTPAALGARSEVTRPSRQTLAHDQALHTACPMPREARNEAWPRTLNLKLAAGRRSPPSTALRSAKENLWPRPHVGALKTYSHLEFLPGPSCHGAAQLA